MSEVVEEQSVRVADVQSLLERELNLTVASPDTDLIETGLLDSLLLVDLIMLIESNYGVSVDITQLEFADFQSVENICKFIQRNS